MIITGLLEQTEKSVVDNARQLSVLKKCHFVHKVNFVVRLLGLVTTHGHVLEDHLEVWLDYLVHELFVCLLVIVFNQNYFVVVDIW